MQPRLNYFELSSKLSQKLMDLGMTVNNETLDPNLLELVYMRASQINGCGFCIDMHAKKLRMNDERELRLHHIIIWRESTLFNERERAAFEWTEEVTKLNAHGISDEAYEKARAQFSDKELSDLTFAISVINVWNRLNVSFRQVPGSLDKMLGLAKSELK